MLKTSYRKPNGLRFAGAILTGGLILLSACSSSPVAEQANVKATPTPIHESLPPLVKPVAAVAAPLESAQTVQITGSRISRNDSSSASVIGQVGAAPPYVPVATTANYPKFKETTWRRVVEEPVSTFSADVDTGSYANVRRFLNRGSLPPIDAVRVEEMLNYFAYDYVLPAANASHPFSTQTQLAAAPWNQEHGLLRIAIKAKDVAKASLPPANLVFLVDVSGSMSPADRLPLVQAALKLLVKQIRSQDKISLVTYASGTQVVLPATSGQEKEKIFQAIDNLRAGGATYGEAGIRLAYQQAHAGFIANGINRVLIATDGDFNVGTTGTDQLKQLVEAERKSGIGFSTLGVGDNNFNESLMKQLADIGDGSYHYLDSLQEAHKVLVNEFTSTLAVVAQDLKLQLEFNPAYVQEYRLIGYEMRALSREQFNDDKVDAGDIGSGHTVTALYEIIPPGVKSKVDPLRYQKEEKNLKHDPAKAHELAWLKLRYKKPGESHSQLLEVPIAQLAVLPKLAQADSDFRFAAAVAGWGQWLRGSSWIGDWKASDSLALARTARGDDPYGHRSELLRLIELSEALKK